MTRTYARLEKIVVSHLQNVRGALEENTPSINLHANAHGTPVKL